MLSPLVSIYVPTHNRPALLVRALESIERQAYKNIEVLVCDDGSAMDLSNIQEKFAEKFSNFVWMRNESPLGACASRNRLIEVAKGEYITGLDDDDELELNRIELFLQSSRLSCYSFLCSSHIVDYGGFSRAANVGAREIGLSDLCYGNIVGSQIFIKTSKLLEVGGFDSEFPAWQDYDTWLRLVKKFGVAYRIFEPTYRVHVSHEMNRITASPKAYLGYKAFVKKHADVLDNKMLECLRIRDVVNRAQSVRIRDLLLLPSWMKTKIIVKYAVKRLGLRFIR